MNTDLLPTVPLPDFLHWPRSVKAGRSFSAGARSYGGIPLPLPPPERYLSQCLPIKILRKENREHAYLEGWSGAIKMTLVFSTVPHSVAWFPCVAVIEFSTSDIRKKKKKKKKIQFSYTIYFFCTEKKNYHNKCNHFFSFSTQFCKFSFFCKFLNKNLKNGCEKYWFILNLV